MDHSTDIFLALFVIFVAAQLGAEAAQRLRLPAVVGEIAAGCLVGPSVLGWVRITAPVEAFAELGAVLLLFAVGLETRVADLRRVGRVATTVGVAGVVLPFLLASVWAVSAGFPTPKAMFVAAAFVATSAGITARVLHDLGVLNRTESRVILGAAVIDDILAMLLLGVVTAIQGGGGVNLGALLLVLGQAIAFVALIALVGTRLMRRASPVLDAPINPLSPLTLCLAGCLGLAAAAAGLGLAAIIGAFLAGMVAAESRQRAVLERQTQVLMAFLVPFFFVVTGAKVDLRELAGLSGLGTVLLVTLLAAVGKLVGCGIGARSLGRRAALVVGVGMVPRGEVGIIVASLGLQAGIFSGSTYAVIIAMSLLTSMIAPPVLKSLFARERDEPAPEAEGEEAGTDAGSDEEEASQLFAVEETGHNRPHSRGTEKRQGPVTD